jgi:small-conductance mechanosensitive channel
MFRGLAANKVTNASVQLMQPERRRLLRVCDSHESLRSQLEQAQRECAEAKRVLRPLLDAGERLVARFGTKDAMEFVDVTMAYTRAHNAAEKALSTPPAGEKK